jgi:plastocyanin
MGLRRRVSAIAAASAALLVMAATPAIAGQDPYSVNDDFFDPAFPPKLSIPAACFTWNWAVVADAHNVRQDRKLFYSGPLTSDDSASFGPICASAGTFHYYCENHGSASGGMDGRLRVVPNVEGDVGSDRFRVRWGQGLDHTGDRFDVRFRVGDGRWKDWRKDTRKDEKTFGRNDNPVDVKPNRTYSFKVRSQKGPNDNKVSGFSPKLTVET